MSTALAVAGVTAVLRGLLDDWLQDQHANDALDGENAEVTAVAPDIIPLGENAGPRLNLFLHQVSMNNGWRNVDQPSRDARGQRTASPPLALDLHYLLTAYGRLDLHAEVLLGFGMQLLHEVPVLGREQIEDRLPPALETSQLGRQVEMIKITPQPMSTDEVSKLWSALQAHYRPTAAYQVSVVLIESQSPGRAAPPVLTRGPVDPATNRERGIVVQGDLLSTLPGLTAVRPPDMQPGAVLGNTVSLDGHHLGGSQRAVQLQNLQLGIDLEVPALAGTESGRLRFQVPNAPPQLPVGTYALRALVRRPGETARRDTNQLALSILPDIVTALPIVVARDAAGTATVNLSCRPEVRAHQRVSLVVGAREVLAEPRTVPTANLAFEIADAPAGTHLLRLRVDGIESLLVDRTVTPPVFLDRRITIT